MAHNAELGMCSGVFVWVSLRGRLPQYRDWLPLQRAPVMHGWMMTLMFADATVRPVVPPKAMPLAAG